ERQPDHVGAVDAESVQQLDDITPEVVEAARRVRHRGPAVTSVVVAHDAVPRRDQGTHLRVPHAEITSERSRQYDDLSVLGAVDHVVHPHGSSFRLRYFSNARRTNTGAAPR